LKMVTVYAISCSLQRYAAEGVSLARFVKAVALDSGLPEARVLKRVERSRDSADFDLVYDNHGKIVKFDGKGAEILE